MPTDPAGVPLPVCSSTGILENQSHWDAPCLALVPKFLIHMESPFLLEWLERFFSPIFRW